MVYRLCFSLLIRASQMFPTLFSNSLTIRLVHVQAGPPHSMFECLIRVKIDVTSSSYLLHREYILGHGTASLVVQARDP